MNKVFAIAQRELKSYFTSPLAYILIAMFLLVSGYFFALILYYTREASMRNVLANMSVVLLLISPMISMRLIAEEKRSGTIELLHTSPVTDWGIVLGKYLGACGLLFVMLGMTGYFPLVLAWFGDPDPYPILTGYLGTFFMGAAFLAIGLLTSSWTRNQIIAGASAFALSLVLWFIGGAQGIFGGAVGDAVSYMSLGNHMENFAKGVIDTTDIIYYVSVIITALYLSVRSLETRQWR